MLRWGRSSKKTKKTSLPKNVNNMESDRVFTLENAEDDFEFVDIPSKIERAKSPMNEPTIVQTGLPVIIPSHDKEEKKRPEEKEPWSEKHPFSPRAQVTRPPSPVHAGQAVIAKISPLQSQGHFKVVSAPASCRPVVVALDERQRDSDEDLGCFDRMFASCLSRSP